MIKVFQSCRNMLFIFYAKTGRKHELYGDSSMEYTNFTRVESLQKFIRSEKGRSPMFTIHFSTVRHNSVTRAGHRDLNLIFYYAHEQVHWQSRFIQCAVMNVCRPLHCNNVYPNVQMKPHLLH